MPATELHSPALLFLLNTRSFVPFIKRSVIKVYSAGGGGGEQGSVRTQNGEKETFWAREKEKVKFSGDKRLCV